MWGANRTKSRNAACPSRRPGFRAQTEPAFPLDPVAPPSSPARPPLPGVPRLCLLQLLKVKAELHLCVQPSFSNLQNAFDKALRAGASCKGLL